MLASVENLESSGFHFIPVVAEQTSTGRFATQTLASFLKKACAKTLTFANGTDSKF